MPLKRVTAVQLGNALERLLDAVETYSSGSLGEAEDQARDILERDRRIT